MLDWQNSKALLELAEKEMSERLNGAIADTLHRYGIAPTNGDGLITGGPGSKSSATWAPAYHHRFGPEEPLLRQVQLANGQRVHLKWEQGRSKEERAHALTWLDGRVDVLDSVFEKVYLSRSPRFLAILLYHESVHFDQLRTGNWKTLNAREADAYRATIAAAPRFRLTPGEIQELREILAYNERRLADQRTGQERYPANLPPPDIEARNSEEWAEFDTARRLAVTQRLALELNLHEERRSRESARNSVVDPETQARVIARARGDAAYSALGPLIARICDSPKAGGITSDLLVDWGAWLDSHFLALSKDNPWADMRLLPGPVDCRMFLENQIIVARKEGLDPPRLDIAWLRGVLQEVSARTNPSPSPSQGPGDPSPSLPEPYDPGPSRPDPTPPDYNRCIHGRCAHR